MLNYYESITRSRHSKVAMNCEEAQKYNAAFSAKNAKHFNRIP